MLTPQLTNAQLTASLFAWWDANFPLEVATIYPGTKLDTSTLDEWLELWLDAWSPRTHRTTGNQLTDLAITLHCFARQQLDKARIHQLADAVQATLTHAVVPIRNFDEGGHPLLGYAHLRETETRDLSRADINARHHSLQHLVLTTTATAQPI